MTFRTLIFNSLRHRWRSHLGVVLGAAVGSAALIGALIVGDSVRESLRERALERLGWVDAAMAPADRFFTQALDNGLAPRGWLAGGANGRPMTVGHSAVALKLPGTAVRQGGTARANSVNVLGVDADFWSPSLAQRKQSSQSAQNWRNYGRSRFDSGFPHDPSIQATNHLQDAKFAGSSNTVILNEALAAQLNARVGDDVVLRIHKPTALSRDVPVSPQTDASVALRLKVCRIVTASELGNFSLRASQTPPLNAFVRLDELEAAAGLKGKANLLLAGQFQISPQPKPLGRFGQWWNSWAWRVRILPRFEQGPFGLVSASPNRVAEMCDAHVREARSLADFEVEFHVLPETEMAELRSSRIFLEPAVTHAVAATIHRQFVFPSDAKVNDPNTGLLLDPVSGRRLDTGPISLPLVSGVTNLFQTWQKAATNRLPILTYLVNQFRADTNTTPYSMVTAAGPPWTPPDMRDDEIIVNQWLADDLHVAPGDSVDLTYFLPESTARLEEGTNRFRVRAVVPMKLLWADRTLMPEFPGLSKAESTHDWDAGFPLVHKIREQDEQYWKQHRGTPKAFLTLAAGQRIWSNRFGALTAIRFPVPNQDLDIYYHPATNAQVEISFGTRDATNHIERNLLSNLNPADFGLRFEPVRDQALQAANQSQDFGGLFIGFSFFLIAAALILMGLLFQFGVEQRAAEVGTLLALGFTPKQVRRLFLLEGMSLALIGGIIGTVGGIGYAWLMLRGLTTIWREAVGTSALGFHVTPQTLMIGLVSAVVVGALTIWVVLRKQARRSARELLVGESEVQGSSFKVRSWRTWIAPGCLAGAAGLVGWALAKGDTANAEIFFSAGSLCLIGGLGLVSWWLARLAIGGATFLSPQAWRSGDKNVAAPFTLASLGVRGCTRRRKRSLAVAALLACGVFLIASIGVFRLDANVDAWRRSSGTGGFALIGQSTMPVVKDLNTTEGREFFGLDEKEMSGVSFVPFRVREGDDASCLNLNRAQKPRLLGVKSELLKGRFTFTQMERSLFKDEPWEMLGAQDSSLSPSRLPNEVPAIGDAASIQWALGKKVGDTMDYTDERGRTFKLRLVGAVANSILQGSLIIDEAEFVQRFPSEAGYRMFLMDTPSNRVSQVSAALSRALQDTGLELTPSAQRLAQFNAVQNTYLNTFQVLGGLGLLLGSAGLGVVVLRNVLERRAELAVLLAVGWRRRQLIGLVLGEHAVLLGLGLAVGVASALVAVLPALLSPAAELPWRSLGATLAAVCAVGLIATWGATRLALRGPLLESLRSE